MNDKTVAALNRINSRFYREFADAFGATRSQPWPGWDKAVSLRCSRRMQGEARLDSPSILDVGCGNGRFAEYLLPRLEGPMRYFGVDESPEMLEQARRRLSALSSVEYQLRRWNLVDATFAEAVGDWRFDLVVVFGLLHHIPGIAQRRRLLLDLAGMLEPEGLLLLSFWQFGEQDRFRRRFLDWSGHNRSADEIIDLDQLEKGDYLLTWGTKVDSDPEGPEEPVPRRYCHHTTEDEAEGLVDSLGLTVRESFRSDGRSSDLNLYYVLENSSDSVSEIPEER